MDKTYRHLVAGCKYQVVVPFTDYDRINHHVGETWIFIGSSFLPYDDGLSLFTTINGQDKQIRLQHRPETQGGIISNLEQHLVQCV